MNPPYRAPTDYIPLRGRLLTGLVKVKTVTERLAWCKMQCAERCIHGNVESGNHPMEIFPQVLEEYRDL